MSDGHDVFVEAFRGGWDGYQAQCRTCDWKGDYLKSGPDVRMAERAKRKARSQEEDHRLATGGSTLELRMVALVSEAVALLHEVRNMDGEIGDEWGEYSSSVRSWLSRARTTVEEYGVPS